MKKFCIILLAIVFSYSSIAQSLHDVGFFEMYANGYSVSEIRQFRIQQITVTKEKDSMYAVYKYQRDGKLSELVIFNNNGNDSISVRYNMEGALLSTHIRVSNQFFSGERSTIYYKNYNHHLLVSDSVSSSLSNTYYYYKNGKLSKAVIKSNVPGDEKDSTVFSYAYDTTGNWVALHKIRNRWDGTPFTFYKIERKYSSSGLLTEEKTFDLHDSIPVSGQSLFTYNNKRQLMVSVNNSGDKKIYTRNKNGLITKTTRVLNFKKPLILISKYNYIFY